MPHEGVIKNHEDTFKEIKQAIVNIQKEFGNSRERIVEIESSSKSAHKRIDNFEKHTEAIIRMTMAVENQTIEITKVANRQDEEKERNDEQDDQIQELKRSPGKFAIKAWIYVLGIIISFILGIILNKIGGL